MIHTDATTDLDEMLGVLASRYRRWILYELMDRESGRIDELIPTIKVLNEAANNDHIDTTRIEMQLHQVHFPKLAEAGFIDYDHRSGDFAHTEKFNEIRDQLEIIETWEPPAVRAEINKETPR